VILRVVGPGRAGSALALALHRAGWTVDAPLGRDDDLAPAAAGVDLLVLAVPDGAIPGVAAAVEPDETTVVAHLAGALGLAVLAGHERAAALHPLVSLPDADTGAARLAEDAWFAVAGDPLVEQVVADLGGHAFTVADAERTRYHAAAVIASNHLVALLGQVERVAPDGVPLVAFLGLARGTVDNVAALGPARALTGPVARGDWATVERHLAALPEAERPAYEAMVAEARRLLP
jgi:predicted short-subunit dehydrogenase-like oxidoreductase (DUF2520 family)